MPQAPVLRQEVPPAAQAREVVPRERLEEAWEVSAGTGESGGWYTYPSARTGLPQRRQTSSYMRTRERREGGDDEDGEGGERIRRRRDGRAGVI